MTAATALPARRRIAFIGPGSVGCCVAAALLERGHELVFIARTPFERLQLRTPSATHDFAAHFVSDLAALGPVDAVILATKAHQTEAVVPWLRQATRGGAPLLVVQNGVDQRERTEALMRQSGVLVPSSADVPADMPAVVPAVVYCAAHREGPGQAVLEGQGALIVPDHAAGRLMASLFEGGFMRVSTHADWTSAAWGKLLMNASMGPLCVLTGRPIDVLRDPQAASLVRGLMQEIIAVGRAAGAHFADDAAEQVLARTLATISDHMPSIAQDRLAGQPTEWVVRNEIIVKLAREHGIAVPLNEAMTTLLRLGEPGSPPPNVH